MIEHKQYDFIEIKRMGIWKYLDFNGTKKEFYKRVKTGIENPYKQAIDSADNFSTWLNKNNKLNLDLRTKKKIFPCVVFPDSPSKIEILELDSWCYLAKGTNGILKNIKNRKWKPKDYISESTIEEIAKKLNLEEISFTDLVEHKANLEMIFRSTARNQVKEIKSILAETNQLNEFNDWIFSVSLIPENIKGKSIKINDININNLPLILNGNFGSGKTIASYQIMEQLLKSNLGVFISLRDIDTWIDADKVKHFIFKDRSHPFPISVEKDEIEKVEEEILSLLSFIIKTLIRIYYAQGLIDQTLNGIRNYLQDRRFFIILDGWDEIQGNSISIVKKILKFLLSKGVPVIITCRSPIDEDLKQFSLQKKQIPIYLTSSLSDTQIESYLNNRIKNWNEIVIENNIINPLRDTFRNNIAPFYLYAYTISPILEIPKNSAQLLRWLVITQVGWELLKDRKDYLKEIKNLKILIEILEKEVISIQNKEISYYNAIFNVEYNGELDISNASVKSILGKIALLEITGKNKNISLIPFLQINPLIKPFIEQKHHPQGLYPYPRIKSKLLQDYFIAEYVLDEYIIKNELIPLISFDIFLIFSQLLDFDERWKQKFINSKQKKEKNQILTLFLTKYPIRLRPTIQDSDFEMIGGGMRIIQSRMRLGVPIWFKELLSACIEQLNKIYNDEQVNNINSEVINAFLKVQLAIPEITSDTIYDGFIKDYEYGHISQSRDPEDYYKEIFTIFYEFQSKQPQIMDKIDKYRHLLEKRKKKWKRVLKKKKRKENCGDDNEEDDEIDWYGDRDGDINIFDSFLFETNHYQKLKFLCSILEYSEIEGLKKWAHYVLLRSSWSGEHIEFLLQENIHYSVINVLLSIYQKLTSDWVDEELGCQQPPEWNFNEEILFCSFYTNLKSKAPKDTLLNFWTILLHFASDLDFINFLLRYKQIFQVDIYKEFMNIALRKQFNRNNALSELINENSEKIGEISKFLNNKEIIDNISSGYILKQNEYNQLLKKNEEELKKANLYREEYIQASNKYNLIEQKEKKKYDDYFKSVRDRAFEHEPEIILKNRFEIHQKALLQELQINKKDLSSSITEFRQIKWILKLFESKFIIFDQKFKEGVYSFLTSKVQAYKGLIEMKSLLFVKIAFYRLITYENCSIQLENQLSFSQDAVKWLRISKLFRIEEEPEEKMKQNRFLNDDWREIEYFIRDRLPNLFENAQFIEFFSKIISSDNSINVIPELLSDLIFTFDSDRNIGNDNRNWKKFSSSFTNKFVERIMEETSSQNSLFSNLWLLLLKIYPYHKDILFELILSKYSEKPKEFDQSNVYHSFLYKFTIKLLKLKYFECVSQIIEEIPIQNIDFLIYSLRTLIFPENFEEIIQITPLITDYAKENLKQIAKLIEKIIERINNDINQILHNNDFEINFSYLFDILVGINPRNKKTLLFLILTYPIYDFDYGKWFLREKSVIFENKDEFALLIQKKVEEFKNQIENEINEYVKKRNREIIDILNEILEAIKSEKPKAFEFKSKIEYKKFTLKTPFDYNNYQPTTYTLDWVDFSESIRVFSVNEKVKLLLRLLFGQKIILRKNKVIFKKSYFDKRNKDVFFPYDKKNGIHILINEIDNSEIIKHARILLANHMEYWYAFIGYMVDFWTVDEVEEILALFEPKEIEKMKIQLTLKFIELD